MIHTKQEQKVNSCFGEGKRQIAQSVKWHATNLTIRVRFQAQNNSATHPVPETKETLLSGLKVAGSEVNHAVLRLMSKTRMRGTSGNPSIRPHVASFRHRGNFTPK